MSNYKEWYALNRERILAARKARYHNDPKYAESIRARSRGRHDSNATISQGYVWTFAEAAIEVGATVWSMREWRKKGYFPEPVVVSGKMAFTANQIAQMKRLKEFFDINGVRMSEALKPALHTLVADIANEWSQNGNQDQSA